MTASREAFLQRVRHAIHQGNRPGHGTALEPRGKVGYQGAGADPVGRFRDELAAAGGTFYLAADAEAAAEQVLQIVQAKAARRALVGRGTVLDALRLPGRLQTRGVEVAVVDQLDDGQRRDVFFAADIGISGVDYLIAETGTIALQSQTHEPRSLSLLPPVHVAVAGRSQLLPDLFDLFDKLGEGPDGPRMPSCLSLRTGPSKTGDIELRLVTGVHGPGEVHVVLVDA